MFNWLKLTPTLLLLISAPASSTVYKCVADDGRISYQSTACENNTDEHVMERISDVPEVVIYDAPERASYTDHRQSTTDKPSKRDLRKQKREALIAQCKPYLKQYNQLKKQVQEKCIRGKNTYCDLPADQIEQKNYQRDLKFSYRDDGFTRQHGVSQHNPRAMVGRLTKPPLLKLKEKLKAMKCIR